MSVSETPILLAAKREGKKYYESSVPCKKHGHVGLRYVSNRMCVECVNARDALFDVTTPRGRARANDEPRYDPGYPCAKGHASMRYVCNDRCVECDNETSRKDHPDYGIRYARTRKHKLKALYGITPEDFDAMISEQHNSCAICNTTFSSRKSAHVDHNHLTGRVRGVLCTRCNMGIGYFREDVKSLTKAIQYLENSESTGSI